MTAPSYVGWAAKVNSLLISFLNSLASVGFSLCKI